MRRVESDKAAGEATRVAAARRSREKSLAAREIGPLPPVVDPIRRGLAAGGLRQFCETYFAATFSLPWSPDHLMVIARMEKAIRHGGLFALAMPRGSGKTSLCEAACLWATMHGYRDFVAIVGPEKGLAVDMLESIKVELRTNDLLAEDYPLVCEPIRRLERISQRASGQICDGESTEIVWTRDAIVLPTIEGSPASGAVIKAEGLTGSIRGMKHKRPDGRSTRPSLVIVDDPQTDESARSPSQCAAREAVLSGAVLGLAGPGKKISGFLPCTVVAPGDLADRILNRATHPEWQGERTRMVYSFATDTKAWEEYARLRVESLRAGGDGLAATEFYAAHRESMDAGAVVAWPERRNPDELSALQHAMNLRLRDERAFQAEYQNEPLPPDEGAGEELTAETIAAKCSGLERGVIPAACSHLTAFIDVHDSILVYAVGAWEETLSGYVVDYGSYPKQPAAYYTTRDCKRTLKRAAPGVGREGAIQAGLEALTEQLLEREWKREDGLSLRVGPCLIDAGYETDLVQAFCARSRFVRQLWPSHGRFIGASHIQFADYRPERTARIGFHWRIPAWRAGQPGRHVDIDCNFWKSWVYRALGTAVGDRGCLSLFGQAGRDEHRMLADHCLAEYRVAATARGKTVDEWRQRIQRPENHLFDCLVGIAAAAAMAGVTPLAQSRAAAKAAKKPKRKAVSYL